MIPIKRPRTRQPPSSAVIESTKLKSYGKLWARRVGGASNGKTYTSIFLGFLLYSQFCAETSDFVLGHLVKIVGDAISLQPGRENYKPNYLFKIRTGETESVALYHISYGKHGYAEDFKENSDVPYKISGKNLFLKTPDGHELKLLLCDIKGKATVCGDDIFPSMDPFSQSRQVLLARDYALTARVDYS